jgi:hypothetical protein
MLADPLAGTAAESGAKAPYKQFRTIYFRFIDTVERPVGLTGRVAGIKTVG